MKRFDYAEEQTGTCSQHHWHLTASTEASRHYRHLGIKNAIRPTALGKKNWLFIGEAEAGERSAVLYTIVESCRRRGIDPYAYLRDILTRLPNATNWQIEGLTPEAWAREHQAPLRQAA